MYVKCIEREVEYVSGQYRRNLKNISDLLLGQTWTVINFFHGIF